MPNHSPGVKGKSSPQGESSPTEKYIQMEKRASGPPSRLLQVRHSEDGSMQSAPRSPRAENPFLLRYRRSSATSVPKQPEDPLAQTYSNVSPDTLEKARDKLNPTSKVAARLKFDPQKRSARSLVGSSVPQIPGDEEFSTAAAPSKPPKPPAPPVRTPVDEAPARNRRIPSPANPLTQVVASRPDSGADCGQQRLSFRSTPRHSASSAAGNRMNFFSAQPSTPSSSAVPESNGNMLPSVLVVPGTPSLHSKSLASNLGKKESSMLHPMEDAPPLGSATRPEARGTSSLLTQRTEEQDEADTQDAEAPRQVANDVVSLNHGTLSPSDDSNPSSSTREGDSGGQDSQGAGGAAHQPENAIAVEESPHPADSGEIAVPSDPRTQPVHFDDTAVVPMINSTGEDVPPTERFLRKQEWLHVPSLFYLFANLIELQELQQHRQAAEMDEERKRNGSMISSLAPSWDGKCEAQLVNLQNHISFSVFEVDRLLLNSLFASWSHAGLRSLVANTTKAWTKFGPESKQFHQASFKLLDAISADRSCTVTYTYLYSIRKYIGNMDNFFALSCIFGALTVTGIACVILLGIFGRTHLVASIVLCAVLGVVIIALYVLAMLMTHHNGYADAAATFFREEALSLTKALINQDAETAENSLSRMDSAMWSTPAASERHDSRAGGNEHVSGAHGSVRRGTAESHDGFASMIGRSMQADNPALLAHLERDRQNAFLTTCFNYYKHQQNVQHHQEQILRQTVDMNPLMSDARALGQVPSEGASHEQTGGISAAKNSDLVAGLSGEICITALIWSRDSAATAGVIPALWDHNFLVFSGSLPVLDKAYHHGSERFKVILVHAASLAQGSADMRTVMMWVHEKRPVFFFSEDVSSFPSEIPITSRLEVPFTERDWYALVLSGLGIDEEVSDPPPPSQPFKVPPYTLGRRLGGGAYGNVFEAEMEETGGKCAVKRMYLREDEEDGENGDAGPSSQLREIAQEVEIMSSLSHPNIVKYMFCERDDNCISIFMELCSGGSLSSLISAGELVDPAQVRRILTDILGAVTYLHNKRIVHRDLKPDNVLFRDGRAKVTDFGTAVLKRERGDLRLVKGTFAYMAPEILCGEPYGKACDVWSVGCIAAEVLSVELPQRALGMPEMCEYYRKMDMNSALDIECSVPSVKDFLSSCLQRNPSARKTAAELLQHEMLRAESSALDRWMEILSAKRSEAHKTTGGRNFAMNGSAFDLNSEAADSLKSSQILTPPDE